MSLVSTASFAMEEFDPHRDAKTMTHIRFEKQDELNFFVKEYKEKGKPIGLAVACGSLEMPDKIMREFKSKVPAIENWIGLDLYSTDKSTIGGPHIRMDAGNSQHWKEFAHYLKDNEVEVQTVALTICTPGVSSPIIHDTLLPLVKKGGLVIYPQCFHFLAGTCCTSTPMEIVRSEKYGERFFTSLKMYHDPMRADSYHNKDALVYSTIRWIEETPSSMASARFFSFKINPIEAEKKLEAKVFVNFISSFKSEYLNNGDLNRYKLRSELKTIKTFFTKTTDEFLENYFIFFNEYMEELGFDSSSYKIFSSNKLLKGVELYIYPEDGTFKLTGYCGNPSLVLIKK
jgi:hypothetical protein